MTEQNMTRRSNRPLQSDVSGAPENAGIRYRQTRRGADRPRAGGGRRRPARRLRTVTRAAAIVLVIAAAVIAFSFAQAMRAPSSLPLSMRAVEWVRDHGGAGVVSWAERVFYTATAPKAGGPSLKSLPSVGVAAAPATGPADVVGAISPMLPNEGVWHGIGRTVLRGDAVRVTSFRPEAAYPRQVAYAAWIDTSRVRLELYPGRVQPPDASPRGPMEVPHSLRSRLLATFNSGFTYKDSRGGFAVNGRTMEPMRGGQGTVVEYVDGRVDVVSWSGGSSVASDVVLARQNLPLLVDGGRPSPRISDGSSWGVTLGNAVRVWRSALGVDGQGNLIYLAAPGQTASSLAGAMVRVGAVRAMQLDINSFWPTFITYGRPGAESATKLVPNRSQTAARYLTPDDRDFFAVYAAQKIRVAPPR